MSETDHTLFLWLRGAFPRRIAYQLLVKGVVASAEDMLVGRTNLPNFKINISTFVYEDGSSTFVYSDPSDPKPEGKTNPCLRIRKADGEEHWISESTAIIFYLEEYLSDTKPLIGKDMLQRAQAIDLITQINLLGSDFSYYLRHSAPITQFWSGLADDARSHSASKNALDGFTKSLVKLQNNAEPLLDSTGWLTLGVDGPGAVDVALAANVRYLWLGYEFDVFEDQRLGKLREWWARFTSLEWWGPLEETGEVHPPQLRYSKEVREVRNVGGG